MISTIALATVKERRKVRVSRAVACAAMYLKGFVGKESNGIPGTALTFIIKMRRLTAYREMFTKIDYPQYLAIPGSCL
jgi:hypothetical protein